MTSGAFVVPTMNPTMLPSTNFTISPIFTYYLQISSRVRTIHFVVGPINLGIHRRTGKKFQNNPKIAPSVGAVDVSDQITGLHLISFHL